MPPEMFHGKDFTPKADVWGLGSILYFITTLKEPFT